MTAGQRRPGPLEIGDDVDQPHSGDDAGTQGKPGNGTAGPGTQGDQPHAGSHLDHDLGHPEQCDDPEVLVALEVAGHRGRHEDKEHRTEGCCEHAVAIRIPCDDQTRGQARPHSLEDGGEEAEGHRTTPTWPVLLGMQDLLGEHPREGCAGDRPADEEKG